jgi:Outer mitochondrial membrane transport complex protein
VGFWLQLPVLQSGPFEVADSTFIIKFLEATWPEKALPRPGDAYQQGVAAAAVALAEKQLILCLVYHRWINPNGYEWVEGQWFKDLRWPLRFLVPLFMRRKVYATLKAEVGSFALVHSRDFDVEQSSPFCATARTPEM